MSVHSTGCCCHGSPTYTCIQIKIYIPPNSLAFEGSVPSIALVIGTPCAKKPADIFVVLLSQFHRRDFCKDL